MNSYSRRRNFIGLSSFMLLASLLCTALPSAVTVASATPVTGIWKGESVCVGNRPACKYEVVVYMFEAIAGKPQAVTWFADKIINGKRDPMGKLECQYDEGKGSLSCEFTKRRTHGIWSFQVSGDSMEGTLMLLPDKSIGRKVKVTRTTADQVPEAPPREAYDGE